MAYDIYHVAYDIEHVACECGGGGGGGCGKVSGELVAAAATVQSPFNRPPGPLL